MDERMIAQDWREWMLVCTPDIIDLTDQLEGVTAERDEWKQRAEKAEAICRCHPFDGPEDPELIDLVTNG